jgi:Crinkler effector protein N-terminal domain
MINVFISLQRLLVRRTNLLGTASNTSLEVTQPVPVLDPTQLLSLNCLVVGDDLKKVFTVKIPKTENVSILKDLIKEKKAPHLDHVAASDLDLWNISLAKDDVTDEKLKNITSLANLNDDVKALGLGQSLDSMETLSNIPWSDLGGKKIHVIIGRLRQSGELLLAMSLLSFLNRQQHEAVRPCPLPVRLNQTKVCYRNTIIYPYLLMYCLVPFRKRYGSRRCRDFST